MFSTVDGALRAHALDRRLQGRPAKQLAVGTVASNWGISHPEQRECLHLRWVLATLHAAHTVFVTKVVLTPGFGGAT